MTTLRFGSFVLDVHARQLIRDSRAVALSPKAFDLLVLLVERRPRAVSKSEIHERLWPATFVSEGNVAVLVGEIRHALHDRARDPAYVRTVQRFGYAFSGTVSEGSGRASETRQRTSCWILWNAQRLALGAGENVLGRDPSADVRIDAAGVSRRHALIVVDTAVTLTDLSSKNGTFAGGVRVTAPLPLHGDTELRLGPIPLRFCRTPGVGSTQTWDSHRPGPSHDR